MTDLQTIAHEIDRLVWAVGDQVRASHEKLPASAGLNGPTFGALLNLLPFSKQLSEPFIRRRYIYRPEASMLAFLTELESGGYLARDGDRLRATTSLDPIVDEVAKAGAAVCRYYWGDHQSSVKEASAMARQVLDAGSGPDGLVAAAQQSAEPDDPCHRLWHRLAGLRLIRNEAHVGAWRSLDLGPDDVEALTDARAGTPLQGPVTYGDNLVRLGFVAEGVITDAGLAARAQIEEATDAGVAPAFAVIDASAFHSHLALLPPAGRTR